MVTRPFDCCDFDPMPDMVVLSLCRSMPSNFIARSETKFAMDPWSISARNSIGLAEHERMCMTAVASSTGALQFAFAAVMVCLFTCMHVL